MPNETHSPLDFSPRKKNPGVDHPILAIFEAVCYEAIHLVAIQIEVFLASGFGVRYLRKRHVLTAGVFGAFIVAVLWFLRVPGWYGPLGLWAGWLLMGCIHTIRSRYHEIKGEPLSENTRFAGHRWLVGGLAQAMELPSSPAWVHLLWEPLSVAVCGLAILAGFFSFLPDFLPEVLPVVAWLGLCGVALLLKALILYSRFLEMKRDLQDAECQAHLMAAQRNNQKAAREQHFFEVFFVPPPPPGEEEELDLELDLEEPEDAEEEPPVLPESPPPAPQPRLHQPSSRVKGRCGNCKCKLDVTASLAGKRVRCPNCQRLFTVPVPRIAA